MRSELVFRAREKVANRYLLCQTTAKTTRCLDFVSASTSDAITDAFVRIADLSSFHDLPQPADSAPRPVAVAADIPSPTSSRHPAAPDLDAEAWGSTPFPPLPSAPSAHAA